MKTKWLDRTLLISPYHFCLCTKEKQFKKELKRLGIKDKVNFLIHKFASATTHYFESPDGLSAIVCIRIADDKTIEQIYALLAHEAVHIWQAIKDNLGESYPGKESEAYAIQNIAQELFISYREQTK